MKEALIGFIALGLFGMGYCFGYHFGTESQKKKQKQEADKAELDTLKSKVAQLESGDK